MEHRSEHRHVSRKPVLGHGVPGGSVRAAGTAGRAERAEGRPAAAPAGLGGERTAGAGERAEHHASDTVPAAAAEPTCPACEYASDLTRVDPTVAFCTGVARALAATERRVVSFPFHFCRAHRAIVSKKTQEAIEGEGALVAR